MPSERSITTRLVPICSQNPRRSTKRNWSTASAPRGSRGMSSVYLVLRAHPALRARAPCRRGSRRRRVIRAARSRTRRWRVARRRVAFADVRWASRPRPTPRPAASRPSRRVGGSRRCRSRRARAARRRAATRRAAGRRCGPRSRAGRESPPRRSRSGRCARGSTSARARSCSPRRGPSSATRGRRTATAERIGRGASSVRDHTRPSKRSKVWPRQKSGSTPARASPGCRRAGRGPTCRVSARTRSTRTLPRAGPAVGSVASRRPCDPSDGLTSPPAIGTAIRRGRLAGKASAPGGAGRGDDHEERRAEHEDGGDRGHHRSDPSRPLRTRAGTTPGR